MPKDKDDDVKLPAKLGALNGAQWQVALNKLESDWAWIRKHFADLYFDVGSETIAMRDVNLDGYASMIHNTLLSMQHLPFSVWRTEDATVVRTEIYARYQLWGGDGAVLLMMLRHIVGEIDAKLQAVDAFSMMRIPKDCVDLSPASYEFIHEVTVLLGALANLFAYGSHKRPKPEPKAAKPNGDKPKENVSGDVVH